MSPRLARTTLLLLLWPALALLPPGSLRAADYDVSAASFLGGSGSDKIVGARLLADGTAVLAVNLSSDAAPGGLAPVLLNGATAASPAALVRLSADGRTVRSVTRLGQQVNDLALDAADNLYVALHTGGFLRLDPAATRVVWSRPLAANRYAWRIDAAGSNGLSVGLDTGTADVNSNTPGAGNLTVFRGDGGTVVGTFAGYRHTLDACLDPASATVIHVGWRQATDNTMGGPVQIPYVQGRAFDGTVRWTAYDWDTTPGSDRYLNRPENNMADSRALRCSLGGDNKLYVAFKTAGGNHLFRYDPFDLTKTAPIVGGDLFHGFQNSKSEDKTFFARYEPATGAYLKGQQFTGRLLGPNFNANTIRPDGDIRADALGRVYLGGAAAYGLPLPPHPKYVPTAGQVAFNPYPPFNDNSYLGGAWFLCMDAAFAKRLYCTRLTTGGGTLALDARIVPGNGANPDGANVLFAGSTNTATETYVVNAVQPAWANPSATNGTQGWFGLIAPNLPAAATGETYAGWAQTNFGANANNPAVAGEFANPAGDGVANLLKYALRLDPLRPAPAGSLPVAAEDGAGSPPALTFTFRRDRARPDVSVRVRSSADLAGWTDEPDTLLSTAGTLETRQARVPITAAGRRFLRLEASRP